MRKKIFTLICLSIIMPAMLHSEDNVKIYFTGKTYGIIEPCECPIHPDGGISRRIKLLRNIEENALKLDSGGYLCGGFGDFYVSMNSEERNFLLAEGYKRIEYDAINLGISEIQYSAAYLRNISNIMGGLMCANYEGELEIFKKYEIRTVNGKRVLITGVLSTKIELEIHPDFSASDLISPQVAVSKVISQHYKRGDIVIVLGFMSEQEAKDIIDKEKRIDVFIYGKNEILIKNPYKYKNTIMAQSYYQTKKVGYLDISIKRGKIAEWSFDYLRLSPNMGEIADIFNKTLLILGKDMVSKLYQIYILFDKADDTKKDLFRFLLRNGISFQAIFNETGEEEGKLFQLINKMPEDYITKKSLKVEIDPRWHIENDKELRNYGGEFQAGVFTGMRFINWSEFDIEKLQWDLKLIGMIK